MAHTNQEKKMSYQEAMAYIDSLQVYGSVPGLENIRTLCEKLGNPQESLSFVHIAGTNGKGSTLSFVASALKEAGYRTGCYISPTISEYRERIQVNGKMISKQALSEGLSQIKQACLEMTEEGRPHPTPFEVETALCFWYFKKKGCSLAVLETGLGGSEDATNLIRNTEVAVITSISLDHMGILGSSLTEIARAKAGILKPGCEAVVLKQEKEVMDVIADKCKELSLSCAFMDAEHITGIKSSLEKQRFSYKNLYKNLEITLAGRYQLLNAALSVEVLEALRRRGFSISERAIYEGLKKAFWPGRFQVLLKKPVFIADGAHNRDGAGKLAESIRFYFTNKRIIYIMGILRDKETEEIIRVTAPYAEQILTVPTKGARGLSSYELACEAKRFHSNVTALDSVEEAVELSLLLAGKEGVVIAFGSLSYLGNLMEKVQNRQEIRSDSHGK